MILSDQDIRASLIAGDIVISCPQGDDVTQHIGTSSIDLRLGHFFKVYRHGRHAILDPKLMSDDQDLTELHEVSAGDPFIVQPGEFVLGATFETVTIGPKLVARVEGRSSLGRLGIIIHSTAGFVDSGFEGTITLEIANINRMPVALYPGMRVCQLAFQQLSSPVETDYAARTNNKYAHQIHPQESRIYRDSFFGAL